MKIKKGIVLGGGYGTRMLPLTQIVNKHLFPIFDKPMIYYPIANIMESGIREILLLSNPGEEELFYNLLSNGEHLGISIEYAVQPEPKGLPQAFLLGEKFIGDQPVCLNLGDHILFGANLANKLETISNNFLSTTIFAIESKNPSNYGVITFNENDEPIKIEEKPEEPSSNYIISGLYFYDSNVVEYSKSLEFSNRDELEISDLNQIYLSNGDLNVVKLDKDTIWTDAGDLKRLLNISNKIYNLRENNNIFIGYLENIALNKGYISETQYFKQIDKLKNSEYGNSLRLLMEQ